jgi:SAM-dependent methyltransferase
MSGAGEEFALALFSKSVLKQAKYRQIVSLLGDTAGLACLDVGGDNGVVSFLLRKRGGEWHSADLDPGTVESIRQLVGENVEQIDGGRTPYPDGRFDRIVIIDFLEHIPGDREFAAELRRILRPEGELIVNVPHRKPRSWLNRIRHAIGLTDAWHGHLRPGYSREELEETLSPHFAIREARTYSGTFSEIVDTVLTWSLEFLKHRSGASPSRKGTVVTSSDLAKHRLKFRLLSIAYPFLWLFSRLDRLLFLQEGYKLIVRAEACGATQPKGATR